MKSITVLIGCFIVLLWGWRRVYHHIMRKDGRPLIAHMISFLLALFPARFFAFAYLSIFPPEGVEAVSDMKRFLLCGLFVLSVVGLLILTRKRNVPVEESPEQIEGTDPIENASSDEFSQDKMVEEDFSEDVTPSEPAIEDTKATPQENNTSQHASSDNS